MIPQPDNAGVLRGVRFVLSYLRDHGHTLSPDLWAALGLLDAWESAPFAVLQALQVLRPYQKSPSHQQTADDWAAWMLHHAAQLLHERLSNPRVAVKSTLWNATAHPLVRTDFAGQHDSSEHVCHSTVRAVMLGGEVP